MSVHARGEFALALNQICEERNITVLSIVETIKVAILAAFRKENLAMRHPVEIEKYMSEVNPETGEAHIFEKTESEEKGKDVTPPGFGRIAAQTAKQVILQKIREAEKESILTDYTAKIGGLVNGLILRFDRSNVIVDIGKTEAIMPPPEQVYAEHYRINQRLVFYLAGVKETPKGNVIIVSRVDRGLIEGLFRREIPEVQNATVKIRDVVREPGVRTKVAVSTDRSGVDPIGACVGQKGVRVQAILKELGTSERIDLVLFSEDVVEYLRSALAPAKNLHITLDEKNKIAKVVAPEDQLSLVIGAKGQNVGLASRLTGWRVDAAGDGEGKPEDPKVQDPKIPKIKPASAKSSGEAKKEKKVKEVKPKKVKAEKTVKIKPASAKSSGRASPEAMPAAREAKKEKKKE